MARRKVIRGFKNVQKSIAQREGISMEQAGAILAAATRRAKRNQIGRASCRERV